MTSQPLALFLNLFMAVVVLAAIVWILTRKW
jgi:hypothetical protein